MRRTAAQRARPTVRRTAPAIRRTPCRAYAEPASEGAPTYAASGRESCELYTPWPANGFQTPRPVHTARGNAHGFRKPTEHPHVRSPHPDFRQPSRHPPPLSGRPPTMSALGAGAIRQRLTQGEIFRSGSWSEDNVRGAAYDLRVAEDFLIVPDSVGGHVHYSRGDKCSRPVILDPGAVALVSTVERLCMPWDLVGNISIKFNYSRQGILVLGGMIVDPGFGLAPVNGDWVPKDDERLHFILANVGQSRLTLVCGQQRIAAITFLPIEGPVPRQETLSTHDIERDFFERDGMKGGLAFFEATRRQQIEAQKERKAVEDRVRDLEHELQGVSRSTDQVLVFGVFLVAVTLLVALVVVALQILQNDRAVDSLARTAEVLPNTWPAAIVVVSLAAVVLGGLVFVAWWSVTGRRSRRRDNRQT